MAGEPGTSAEQEAELDRELVGTFPASDPLQVTRAPRGAEFTPARTVKPDTVPDETPDETPDPVVPSTSDLKW